MIHFRVREWGASEWTHVLIEGELEPELQSLVGSALDTAGGSTITKALHVQVLAEDGQWEDLV